MNQARVTGICESIIAPLSEKLDNLLETLALKKDIDSLVSNLKNEIEKRDKKISHMQVQIDDQTITILEMQEKLCSHNDRILASEQNTSANENVTESSNIDPAKESIENIIVGDSIIKHVKSENLSEHVTEVISGSGARIEMVYEKIDELSETYNAQNIVLHIGSNNIPHDRPATVASKIIKLVKHVQTKMPKTRIHVSAILPKHGSSFLRGIDMINCQLFDSSFVHGFNFIAHPNSFARNGHLNPRMFAPTEVRLDNPVHLSYAGVAQLERNIKHHLSKASL